MGLKNENNLKFERFNPLTVKSGTLEGLIYHLIDERSKTDFKETFILTHHYFSNTIGKF